MIHPLAITMWDFSWIERRWDGAGFEDWNAALDGVKERGYDAVRIDAFPHLLSQAPEKEWLLLCRRGGEKQLLPSLGGRVRRY